MPTYQYACTACDHRFEAVQAFADDPLTQCPECEGRLRKLFGSVGVVFKGPGFYRTDSRTSPNGKGAPGGGASDGKPTSESTGKDGSAAKDPKGGKDQSAKPEKKEKTPAASTSTTSS